MPNGITMMRLDYNTKSGVIYMTNKIFSVEGKHTFILAYTDIHSAKSFIKYIKNKYNVIPGIEIVKKEIDRFANIMGIIWLN